MGAGDCACSASAAPAAGLGCVRTAFIRTGCELVSPEAAPATGRICAELLSLPRAFPAANFSTKAFSSSMVWRCAATSLRNWLTSSLVALPELAPSVLLAGSVA